MLLNSGKRKSCNDYNVRNLPNGKLLYKLYKWWFQNKILACDIIFKSYNNYKSILQFDMKLNLLFQYSFWFFNSVVMYIYNEVIYSFLFMLFFSIFFATISTLDFQKWLEITHYQIKAKCLCYCSVTMKRFMAKAI